MSYVPLGVKTDYSLLNSLIKINDLIKYALDNNFNTIGILDDNLYSSYEFYKKCYSNKIKPIIGVNFKYNDLSIYLYPKDYLGLQNLFKLHDLNHTKLLNDNDLKLYNINVILVLPYESYSLYNELNDIFENVYLCYKNEVEKKNALVITDKIVYINDTKVLSKTDSKLLNYLNMIKLSTNTDLYNDINYSSNYLLLDSEINEYDTKTTLDFSSLIKISWTCDKIHLPKYQGKLDNNELLLKKLCIKGLKKRLNNNISNEYQNRLLLELNVIKEMGFIDYFLIVYDYVLYAKKNNILVGPGRGSAAGSLVAYSLGITGIDPIKYDLLFERFLNKERVTLPDIDLDFEDIKRDEIKEYLKNKYGESKVSSIITFSTLGSKQVVRDVLKVFNAESEGVSLLKEINANISLKDNYNKNKVMRELIDNDPKLKNIFYICTKLEGLKKTISVHASGTVVSDENIVDLIPTSYSGNNLLTGITYEYLEDFGLLKMDLLALNNLTIIHNTLDLIIEKIDLYNIPLDDEKTIELFSTASTDSVFQFESTGMKNFLKKLKPSKFSDLYAATALYRPGPMDNIDLFIERKHGLKKIEYLHPDLKPILEETYGVIVYQEQIMQILSKMAGYSYSESDLVRKSMSKKDHKTLEHEKQKFIDGSLKNGYNLELSNEVFDLILKFASYGFNKAHSVSYALISYWLGYLKANYTVEFMTNLLNMSLGSVNKTINYINQAKQNKIKIMDFNLTISKDKYYFIDNNIYIPLALIKGINDHVIQKLMDISAHDITDIYKLFNLFNKYEISKDIIINLTLVGALDYLEFNRNTILNNIDKLIDYAEIGESNISKPIIELYEEMHVKDLLDKEIELCGFYISNHPTTMYYKNNMVKLKNVSSYFDINITCVVLVDKVKSIKTKKNEDMAFITGSDETGSMELILFPRNYKLIEKIKENILINISGKVTKKNDRYGIIINKVENIEG